MQPTIFQAVHSSLSKNYANFKGRACRAEFWWTMLFYILVEVALTAAVGFISSFYWDIWIDPTKLQIIIIAFYRTKYFAPCSPLARHRQNRVVVASCLCSFYR